MRNVWLSGKSMDLFVNSLETKSRLTHLIAPYISSDKLLVKSKPSLHQLHHPAYCNLGRPGQMLSSAGLSGRLWL